MSSLNHPRIRSAATASGRVAPRQIPTQLSTRFSPAVCFVLFCLHHQQTWFILSVPPHVSSPMARPKSFLRRESTKSLKAATIKINPKSDFASAPDAAVLEKATIESLRNVQHKDADGNIISEFATMNALHVEHGWSDLDVQPSLTFQTRRVRDLNVLWTPSARSRGTSRLATVVAHRAVTVSKPVNLRHLSLPQR